MEHNYYKLSAELMPMFLSVNRSETRGLSLVAHVVRPSNPSFPAKYFMNILFSTNKYKSQENSPDSVTEMPEAAG
jgi:hypothetical protein